MNNKGGDKYKSIRKERLCTASITSHLQILLVYQLLDLNWNKLQTFYYTLITREVSRTRLIQYVHSGPTLLTWEGLQALTSHYVPHFYCRVCISRDEDIVAQLHAWREGLVPHQCVSACPRLHLPHPDAGVQRSTHHMDPIKLCNTWN
jgi:hypothetical protein